ncbi:MAG: NAD(P)/FAD-dependent oxidoreductase [Candidatus Omnitrophica bacterium]|nr:NAD(P)/FAD-dependent oxidoreductase [Candidatus Omnitrophota bacterium]
MNNKNRYDAIIIGAGIGGLVCGCYLAKAGHRVLIIEKNDRPGGCCVTFKRKGFRFDAGAHILGSCGRHSVLSNILRRLNIDQEFVRMEPAERFFFGYDEYEVPANIREYITYLQDKFPLEKKGIKDFFDKLIHIARNINSSRIEYDKITYEDLLNKNFNDIRLKSVLSAQIGYLGITPNRISAVAMCAMMASYLKDGTYYPMGGAGLVSDKLADRFKSLGGEMRLRAEVAGVITDDSGSAVVKVKSGRGNAVEFYGGAVVSDIDIGRLFRDLIPRSSMHNTIKRNLSVSEPTPSLAILYLGVELDKKVIKKKVGWHYPDYDVNINLDDCLYISSPSLYDESAAPKNMSAMEVFQIWDFPGKSGAADYKKYKKEIERKMLEKVVGIIPDIKDSLVVIDSATPVTIERYTANRNGAAYGWAMTPGQYDRNDIMSDGLADAGIYLVGHWTNPGGGVLAAAISGYSVSRKMITDGVFKGAAVKI